ncbi:MAG: sarcosine oxidase subunit gamma [Silicimonas sp.]|nr:sarcosine oxidase subunit gamma [Silicimonas sp.]
MSKPLIQITDAAPLGMITLRCDQGLPALQTALSAAGRSLPEPGMATGQGAAATLWMSPDELMLTSAHGEADALVAQLAEALKDEHALVVNVSDARAAFRLTGRSALLREVLAKLSPADLRGSSLPVGRVRRTRLAQVPAAFWFEADDCAMVVAFRSVGDYVAGLLAKAAEPGSEVGFFVE